MSAIKHDDLENAAKGSRFAMARLKRLVEGREIYLALLAISLVATALSPVFLTEINLRNIFNQASVLGILACAQFLVVLIGGFDLSVAAIMALGSVLFATYVPVSTGFGALVALGGGASLGFLSGISVTFGRVAPLIATLGVMGIARGFAFVVSEKSIAVDASIIAPFKSQIYIFSVPVLVWATVTAVLAVVLARTRFGRNLYAIGGNATAARLAGIPVRSRIIAVYTVSGLLSGLGGLALVMRVSSGVPQIGAGWALDTIAAIVIGGTRLFGGEGNIVKAMAGVLIYQMIANIMNLVNLDPFYQDMVKAIVILAVVGFSVRRAQSAQKGATP